MERITAQPAANEDRQQARGGGEEARETQTRPGVRLR
jgi:hypothetical protein